GQPYRPRPHEKRAEARSGGPAELGRRKAGLALVADAEGVDLRALRLRHGQLRPRGMEHPGEPDRLAVFDPEGDDVLDLEVDRAADPHAVADAVVDDLDRRTLDAQHLPDQRYDTRHRPAELAAEDRRQLLGLLVRRSRVDEHADAPVAVRHHLRRIGDRRHLQAGDVGAVDLALADVEDEHDAAVVVRGAVGKRRVARADEVARARLDVAAFQVPGHVRLRFYPLHAALARLSPSWPKSAWST